MHNVLCEPSAMWMECTTTSYLADAFTDHEHMTPNLTLHNDHFIRREKLGSKCLDELVEQCLIQVFEQLVVLEQFDCIPIRMRFDISMQAGR